MRKHLASIRQEDDENEINLTPMLDVVFIMLIFFIVTASFIRETAIPVNPPEPGAVNTDVPESILVVIDESSDIWIDRRLIDPRAVRANIARLYAENPQASVVIQADARSHNDTLVQVMNASREAGIYEVKIAETDEAAALN